MNAVFVSGGERWNLSVCACVRMERVHACLCVHTSPWTSKDKQLPRWRWAHTCRNPARAFSATLHPHLTAILGIPNVAPGGLAQLCGAWRGARVPTVVTRFSWCCWLQICAQCCSVVVWMVAMLGCFDCLIRTSAWLKGPTLCEKSLYQCFPTIIYSMCPACQWKNTLNILIFGNL